MSVEPTPRRARLRTLGLLSASFAVALGGTLATSTATVGATPATVRADQDQHRPVDPAKLATREAGRYVVVLTAPPAASYDGGNSRFAATRARGQQEFRGDSAAVRAYSSHLRSVQRTVADKVGVTPSAQYSIALNGFTAQLSAAQATELAADKNVLLLAEDELRDQDTFNTPGFLGLDGPQGAWEKSGGRTTAGDGVVVGIIDSGFWPGTGSFVGKPIGAEPSTPWDITMDGAGNTRMEKVDGSVFTGACEAGEQFTLAQCNSKVISAKFYGDSYLGSVPPDSLPESEFVSPRDGSGHGSHTASTAAGARKADVSVEGREFGAVSGMAPAAKLAVYKVCWENVDPDLTGCYTSDSIAAIDDAVADGVDLLNYSISGSLNTVIDPVELAFEGAAEAGVFVAASAGNSGPTASTVAHNSPWLTTVAAGTHANFEGTAILNNGEKLLGASISGSRVERTAMVTAESSVVAGGDAADAKLCGPDTLDPAKAADKVVVCYRGVYDRVAKSAEVERAGGVAMLLVNPTPSSIDADFHAVPTIHLSDTDGAKVEAYLAESTAPSVLFVPGNRTGEPSAPLPQVAGFSSRGPALANDGGLLKPDITAPGQSVLAAVAPPSNFGRRYDLYSGTSMSSPHIAGLAAFMMGENPDWTPMEVKSAMMTTAGKMKNAAGKNEVDVLAAGAGQVQPTKFFDPGLFVTETGRNWRGFITGQGLDTGVPAVDARDLNIPSFADSAVAGETSFTRTFRATKAGTWKVNTYLPGFEVTASPASVVSKRVDDLIEVTFTFTRTTADLESYAKGAITLAGPTQVRMPVALRPVAVAVPDAVSGEGATGSVEVPLVAGSTGTVDITTTGLAQGDVYADQTVAVGEDNLYCYSFVPGQTKLASIEVDAADDTADLDLVVYSVDDCDTLAGLAEVGVSATGAADERVVLEDPDSPFYLVQTIGFSAGQDGAPMEYTDIVFDVGGAPGLGSFTATPDPVPVVQGEETSFEAGWTGLEAGFPYLGLLEYGGSPSATLVEVEVGAPPAP